MKPEFEETGETLIGVAVAFCSRRFRVKQLNNCHSYRMTSWRENTTTFRKTFSGILSGIYDCS